MKEKHSLIHKFIRFLIIIFILIFILFLYGYYLNPYMFKVIETPIIDSNFPSDYNGLKIVHFTDIHYGRTTNEPELKKITNEINKLNADIVVFTGDLFDLKNINSKDEKIVNKYFKKIEAKLFKFAIIGDYDNKNISIYKNILENTNFTLLDNTSKLVYYNSSIPLNFIGLSNTNNIDSLYNNDYFNITLIHKPDLSKNINNSKIILAGHSLGGQIKIPFIGGIKKIDGAKTYINDFYELNNNTKLYISNGLGTQDNNFRLFNTPSITLYRLYNY